MGKPNIVLFMVDQLTSFVLNAYGGRVCKTPNIDALAARGTVFDTAYCAYPLCLPSRYAMMTGRLPSKIGAYDNGAELPAATPTFAHYLRAAGYYTCLSGKMHFVGPDAFHGFEDRLTTEIYPADMSWTSSPTRAGSNGDTCAGVSTIDTVKDAGPVARSMQIDYDEAVVHHAVREIFARARSDDDRPFMLTVSLTQPHDPYVTTQAFWDLYRDDEIDPPRVPPIAVEERDPHSQSVYYHYSQDKCSLSDQDVRNARRGYYGMISQIDAHLGEVIAALEDSGFGDDTIIIFTSDHGDMMGERGMWFKKTLFDPAVQVPLIIAQPGQNAGRVATPVSLLDLFPTLLEFGGIAGEAIVTAHDGVSLVPVMQGATRPGSVLVEHLDGGTAAPRVCVRDGEWKLIVSKAYPPTLFNLVEDPQEMNDLAGQGLSVERELTAIADQHWSLDALQVAMIISQTERLVVDSALSKGRAEPWDFIPYDRPGTPGYVRRGDSFPEVEQRGYLAYPKSR